MYFLHSLGILQSLAVDQVPTPVLLEAQNVTIPDPVIGTEISGDYDYFHSLSVLENNKPILAEELTIAGTPYVGQTLTATLGGLYIPNGQSAGTYVYRWYRCNSTQSTGSVIAGAVTSTYVVTMTDDGKYLRCEVDLVQTGGANLSGGTMYSLFTTIVGSDAFNPVGDITWKSAWVGTDASGFDSVGDDFFHEWANRGLGANATQDGVANLPSWDVTEQCLRFTRTSSQRLLITNQGINQPVEVWIKFKLASLTGNQYLIGFTNSVFLYINSSGDLGVAGATPINTDFVVGTTYMLRVVIQGPTTTVQVNNGPVTTISSGVALFGIGSTQGRIAASKSGGNHFDGWMSFCGVGSPVLSSGNQALMWTWAGF